MQLKNRSEGFGNLPCAGITLTRFNGYNLSPYGSTPGNIACSHFVRTVQS